MYCLNLTHYIYTNFNIPVAYAHLCCDIPRCHSDTWNKVLRKRPQGIHQMEQTRMELRSGGGLI